MSVQVENVQKEIFKKNKTKIKCFRKKKILSRQKATTIGNRNRNDKYFDSFIGGKLKKNQEMNRKKPKVP